MSRVRLPPRVQSRANQLRTGIAENKLPVAVGVALLGYWLVQNGVPGWIITLFWGVLYGAIPSYLVGLYIVTKFFPDTRREIIELNLSDDADQVSARSWFVPDKVWRDRRRGERPALSPESGAEAIVTELEPMEDLDAIRVEGCNPEIADPVDMVARDAKISEIEENLTEKAEQLSKLQATLRSKSLEIQDENVHALMAAVESGTQMDPGAVEQSIQGIDLDLDLDASQHDEEPEPDPERSKAFKEMQRFGATAEATDD